MNKIEFNRLFQEFTRIQSEILDKKGHDYANDTDVFTNFKKVASLRGNCPDVEPIVLAINTKIVRLNNLIDSNTPMNESIEDTLIDLSNYVFLLYALLKEK
jgi:hypothetical protein